MAKKNKVSSKNFTVILIALILIVFLGIVFASSYGKLTGRVVDETATSCGNHVCDSGETGQCPEDCSNFPGAYCLDTDGGITPKLPSGTVSADGSVQDRCPTDYTLVEAYCDHGGLPGSHIKTETIDCTQFGEGYECLKGRIGVGWCGPANKTKVCQDSDGRDPATKGTVTWIGGSTGIESKKRSDSCKDEHTLVEWYCPNHIDLGRPIVYYCPEGTTCTNGACVPGGSSGSLSLNVPDYTLTVHPGVAYDLWNSTTYADLSKLTYSIIAQSSDIINCSINKMDNRSYMLCSTAPDIRTGQTTFTIRVTDATTIDSAASAAIDNFTIIANLSATAGGNYRFDNGETMSVLGGRRVTLLNVGSNGSIIVDVDTVNETIGGANSVECVNGVQITNKEPHYVDTTSLRYAILTIDVCTLSTTCGDGICGGTENCEWNGTATTLCDRVTPVPSGKVCSGCMLYNQ